MFTVFIIVFMIKTINAQWDILNQGIEGNAYSIDFVNDNVGWIAGHGRSVSV